MSNHSGPSEQAIRTVLENFERQQRHPGPQPDNGNSGSIFENVVDGAGLVLDAGDILEGVGEVLGAVAEGAAGMFGEIIGGLGSF